MSNFKQMRLSVAHIIISLLILGSFMYNKVSAQELIPQRDTVYAYINAEGDTVPQYVLPEVTVYTKLTPAQRKYWAEWTRLRNAVYVTYPYAKAASRIMNEINVKLAGVTDKAERRRIIRAREKELKKEFTDKLTSLSVYQGKVLMKLIYRETGAHCFEIIKEYKGSFTASFWQGVAFIFGSSLKQLYDREGAEKPMEMIVRDVERLYGYRS
jgi:hypothetical protein